MIFGSVTKLLMARIFGKSTFFHSGNCLPSTLYLVKYYTITIKV